MALVPATTESTSHDRQSGVGTVVSMQESRLGWMSPRRVPSRLSRGLRFFLRGGFAFLLLLSACLCFVACVTQTQAQPSSGMTAVPPFEVLPAMHLLGGLGGAGGPVSLAKPPPGPTVFRFRRTDGLNNGQMPPPSAAGGGSAADGAPQQIWARFTDTPMDKWAEGSGPFWRRIRLFWAANSQEYIAALQFQPTLNTTFGANGTAPSNKSNSSSNSASSSSTGSAGRRLLAEAGAVSPCGTTQTDAGSMFIVCLPVTVQRVPTAGRDFGWRPVRLHWQLSLDRGRTFETRLSITWLLAVPSITAQVTRPTPQVPVLLDSYPTVINSLHPWGPRPRPLPPPPGPNGEVRPPPPPPPPPRKWIILRSSGGNRLEFNLRTAVNGTANLHAALDLTPLIAVSHPVPPQFGLRDVSAVDDDLPALFPLVDSVHEWYPPERPVVLRFSLEPDAQAPFSFDTMSNVLVYCDPKTGQQVVPVMSPRLGQIYAEAMRRFNASGFAPATSTGDVPSNHIGSASVPPLVYLFVHISLDAGMSFSGPIDFGADFAIQPTQKMKVAYMYPGSVLDFGWTYSHHQANLAVKNALTSAIERTYFENVTVEMKGRDKLATMLTEGQYDMVLLCSSQFYSVAKSLAAETDPAKGALPSQTHLVVFAQSGEVMEEEGRVLPIDTLSSLRMHLSTAEAYLARYLAGMVAGGYAQENGITRIGYIAAFQSPDVLIQFNAFVIGVRALCAECTTHVVLLDTWSNPYQERSAAEHLIAQGFRVIAHHTDNKDAMLSVASAPASLGVVGVGSNSDMLPVLAGDSILTAPYYVWTQAHAFHIQNYLDRRITNSGNDAYTNWKLSGHSQPVEERNQSMSFVGTFADGSVALGPLSPLVSRDVRFTLAQTRARLLRASSLGVQAVFCGPMRDSTGVVRLSEGQCLSAEAAASIDWYVEGVVEEGYFHAAPPPVERNRIGSIERISMFTLLTLCLLAVLTLSVYVWLHQAHPVLQAASANFLQVVLLGALLLLVAGFLLGLDENTASVGALDNICIITPWLLSQGFLMLYGSLFLGLWAVLTSTPPRAQPSSLRFPRPLSGMTSTAPKPVQSSLERSGAAGMSSASKASTASGVSNAPAVPASVRLWLRCFPRAHPNDGVLVFIAVCFSLPVWALLIMWSTPTYRPHWVSRVLVVDADGFPREERAMCEGIGGLPFWITLEAYAVLLLLLGLCLAYRTRNIPSRYSQGKWLALCIVNLLQVLVVLVPLQFMVGTTASSGAVYLLRACTVALSVALLLIFLFLPKLSLIRAQRLPFASSRTGTVAGGGFVNAVMSRISSNFGTSVLGSESGLGNHARSRGMAKSVPAATPSGVSLQMAALAAPACFDAQKLRSGTLSSGPVPAAGMAKAAAADFATAEEDEAPVRSPRQERLQVPQQSNKQQVRLKMQPSDSLDLPQEERKPRKLLPLQAQAATALRDLANSMEDGMSSLNLVRRVRLHNQEVDSHSSMPAGSPHSHSGSLASHLHAGGDEIAHIDLSNITRAGGRASSCGGAAGGGHSAAVSSAAVAAAAAAAANPVRSGSSTVPPPNGGFYQHVHLHLYAGSSGGGVGGSNNGFPPRGPTMRQSRRSHGDFKQCEFSIVEHAASGDADASDEGPRTPPRERQQLQQQDPPPAVAAVPVGTIPSAVGSSPSAVAPAIGDALGDDASCSLPQYEHNDEDAARAADVSASNSTPLNQQQSHTGHEAV